jgi:ribulose-5-phosphate 4-epimerase/fuculose-1-phosphate aldolase
LSAKSPHQKTIIITPDGIPKSELKTGDLFEMKWMFDSQTFVPPSMSRADKPHQIAKRASLYLQIISATQCNFVLECATVWSALASRLAVRAWERNATTYPDRVRLAHWGLLEHLGSDPSTTVPVLQMGEADAMQKSLEKSLKANTAGVLLRDYGLLVWGDSPADAISKAEILDRMCELQVSEFRLLGRT